MVVDHYCIINLIVCFFLQYAAFVMIIMNFFYYYFSGVKLNNNVIGTAYVGTMCTIQYAVGLIQDFSSAAAVSSTAAHELGHIFNMQHDSGT